MTMPADRSLACGSRSACSSLSWSRFRSSSAAWSAAPFVPPARLSLPGADHRARRRRRRAPRRRRRAAVRERHRRRERPRRASSVSRSRSATPIRTQRSARSSRSRRPNEATRTTNVADYLANEYASVAPWRFVGVGIAWLRLVPDARGQRAEDRPARARRRHRGRPRDVHPRGPQAPNPDGAVRSRLVELRLVERLAEDEPNFQISMFRTGRGIVPTGFRNGIRSIVYPVSQFARGLRGG